MIEFPTKAEVHCSDGIAGFSTYIISDPINHQITHVVVQSDSEPILEYLVPVELVEGTAPNRIQLKCTQEDFRQMELFKDEEFIPTQMPSCLSWPYYIPIPGRVTEEVDYIPVEHENIAWNEQAVRLGALVEAIDGTIGPVDELLINSNNMQIAFLVLREKHIFGRREITIPVSQIDHVDENTIYLKLNRKTVEELPNTPLQRKMTLF